MDGMVAIAVPITDDQGRLLTTLSIHAPVMRHDLNSLSAHLEVLKGAAQSLGDLI